MLIGYSTWSTKKMPVEQAIREMSRIGFDAVEIDLDQKGGSPLDEIDAARRREIKRLLDDTGLVLSGFVSAHRNQITGEEANLAGRDVYLRELDLALDLAQGNHIPVMDVAMGGKEGQWEELKNRIVDGVRETVRLSAERGVTVALEPHSGNAVNTPERMRWIVDQVDSPYCKVNFDISHFNVIGIPIEESVRQMAPISAHTHIKDETGRFPNHQFLIPGEGDFDYVRYLTAMQENGWTGDITCEISIMVQNRPTYDAVAAMEQTYRVVDEAMQQAGVPRTRRS